MTIAYPFDPTAINPANKIINEEASVTISNGINAFLIVPDATPFYGTSLSIVNSSGQTLRENVDYYLTHHWQQASNTTGKEVFGTITLLTGYKPGNYQLNYQTIGGEYVTAPANAIRSGIIAASDAFINIDWSTAPTAFPSIPHTEEISGLQGMTQILQGMEDIASAIRSPAAGVHYDDVKDIENVYAAGFAEPLVETMESQALNNEALGSLILTAVSKLQPLLNIAAIPDNLQNYSIDLGSGFMLKTGTVKFQLHKEPGGIMWAGPNFKAPAMYAHCHVAFDDPNAPINTDAVITGRTTKIGVGLKMAYEAPGFITNWMTGNDLPAILRDHNCIKLPDNRLLLTGGYPNGVATNTTYFGTVVGNAINWTAGSALPYAAGDHQTTLLPDGRILLTGGGTPSGATNAVYFGSITGNTINWIAASNLPATLSEHQTVVLHDGRVMVVGGNNGTGAQSTVFIGTISGSAVTWVSGTAVPYALTDHCATVLPDGRVLLTGGFGPASSNTNSANAYFGTITGDTITWVAGTNLPLALWEHQVVGLPDGRIVTISGVTTGSVGTAEVYFGTISGNTITWTASVNLPGVLWGNEAVLMNDDRLLSTGGYNGSYTAGVNTTYISDRIPMTKPGIRVLTYFAIGK